MSFKAELSIFPACSFCVCLSISFYPNDPSSYSCSLSLCLCLSLKNDLHLSTSLALTLCFSFSSCLIPSLIHSLYLLLILSVCLSVCLFLPLSFKANYQYFFLVHSRADRRDFFEPSFIRKLSVLSWLIDLMSIETPLSRSDPKLSKKRLSRPS